MPVIVRDALDNATTVQNATFTWQDVVLVVDTNKPVITIAQPSTAWATGKVVSADVSDATSVTMYYST